MKIKQASTKNNRNFKARASVELSKYNVFIGKNGSGKSNMAKLIFNAAYVFWMENPSIVPFAGKNTEDSDANILLEFEDSDDISKTAYYNPDDSSFRQFCNTPDKLFERHFTFPDTNRGRMKFQSMAEISFNRGIFPLYQSLLEVSRNKTIFVADVRDFPPTFQLQHSMAGLKLELNNFMEFLFHLKLNFNSSFNDFLQLCDRVIPHSKDIIMNSLSQGLFGISLLDSSTNYYVPATEVSKGTREVLVLLSIIALAENGSSVLIEEPEIHLHREAIMELRKIFFELIEKKDLQLTITTHNPAFIAGLYPEKDKSLRFYEFTKSDSGESSVKPLRTDKELAEAEDNLSYK